MIQTTRSTLLTGALGAALFLVACGSGEPAPAQPTAAPAAAAPAPAPAAAPAPAEANATPAAADDAEATCKTVMTRMRDCTDTFIPALVALRVEYDVPPGIAAKDKKEGRDALVAEAKEEWKKDSTDEAIAGQCQHMTQQMPADQLKPMLDAGKACAAKQTCDEVTACLEPIHRKMMMMHKNGTPHGGDAAH